MAIVNMGFSTGVTMWELRLEKDVATDECTCFGAVVKPLANFGYDSTTAFMYRGYNGVIYGPGKGTGSNSKVEPQRAVAYPALPNPTSGSLVVDGRCRCEAGPSSHVV